MTPLDLQASSHHAAPKEMPPKKKQKKKTPEANNRVSKLRLFVLISILGLCLGLLYMKQAGLLWNIPLPGNFTTSDAEKYFANKLESKHFVFYSNLSKESLSAYALFSEQFLELVNKNFVSVQCRFPLYVYILSDEQTCNEFVKTKMHCTDHIMGAYFPAYNAYVTFDGSGLGTLSHEMMHKILPESVGQLEPWAEEGVPTFFEKFYGYPEGNDLVLKFGFINPWRLEELQPEFDSLSPRAIVSKAKPNNSSRESEQHLLAMFLYRQGKLKQYLQLLKQKDKGSYSSYVEAACGKPFPELTVDWQNYLNSIKVHGKAIMRLPPSTVYPSEDTFIRYSKQFRFSELSKL